MRQIEVSSLGNRSSSRITPVPLFSQRIGRVTVALLAAVAAGHTTPSPAAATFEVRACDGAAGSKNRSWLAQRTSPEEHLTAFTNCPSVPPDPEGNLRQGIGIYDTITGGGGAIPPSDGRYAEHRFAAPAGTRIVAADIDRDLGNRDVFWKNYGRVDEVDVPSETCISNQGAAFCRVVGSIRFSALNAGSIAYGARCLSAYRACVNGSTLHMVWALVRSAVVTLDDTEPPTTATPTSAGLADGAWHRGSGVVSFSASDNTGIRVRRVLEGDVVRATVTAAGADAGGCGTRNVGDAYTYLEPCAGDRGLNGMQAVPVADVCAWGDGEHVVRGESEDTGGASSTSAGTATVRADCAAPVVAIAPSSDRHAVAGAVIAPHVTATDAHVAVAATEVELQLNGWGAWRPYTGPVTVAENEAYRFRARATDALGNASGWSVSGWTYGPEDWTDPDPDPDPQPPPAPGETPAAAAADADRPQPPAPQQPPAATAAALDPLLTSSPLTRPTAATRPRVLSQRFDRRRRRLVVTGTGRPGTTVALTIEVTRRTATVRRLTRRATVRHGRFRATVRVPAGTRRARVIRIRVQGLR